MARNSKHGSLKYQLKQALDRKKTFGDSKHKDKQLNGQKPDRDKIYSASTYKNYMGHCMRFAVWIGENHPWTDRPAVDPAVSDGAKAAEQAGDLRLLLPQEKSGGVL